MTAPTSSDWLDLAERMEHDALAPGSWPPGSRWIERPDHRPATPHADDSERTVTPIYGPRGDVIAQVSNKAWVPCGFQPSGRAEEPNR